MGNGYGGKCYEYYQFNKVIQKKRGVRGRRLFKDPNIIIFSLWAINSDKVDE